MHTRVDLYICCSVLLLNLHSQGCLHLEAQLVNPLPGLSSSLSFTVLSLWVYCSTVFIPNIHASLFFNCVHSKHSCQSILQLCPFQTFMSVYSSTVSIPFMSVYSSTVSIPNIHVSLFFNCVHSKHSCQSILQLCPFQTFMSVYSSTASIPNIYCCLNKLPVQANQSQTDI